MNDFMDKIKPAQTNPEESKEQKIPSAALEYLDCVIQHKGNQPPQNMIYINFWRALDWPNQNALLNQLFPSTESIKQRDALRCYLKGETQFVSNTDFSNLRLKTAKYIKGILNSDQSWDQNMVKIFIDQFSTQASK